MGFKRKPIEGLHKRLTYLKKKYPPHSTTSFEAAMDKTVEIIRSEPPDNTVIIFLSDGHDPGFQAACDKLKSIKEEIKMPITLYAIRFGNSKATNEALQKLATLGGGSFSTSRDGVSLNETFGEIRRAMDEKINVWDNKIEGTVIQKRGPNKVDGKYYSIEYLMKKLFVKTGQDEPSHREFHHCFFLVFRSFLSPRKLLQSLHESYDIKEEDMPPDVEKFSIWKMSMQSHFRILFKTWVRNYPEDFKLIRREVDAFISTWREKLKNEIEDMLEEGLAVRAPIDFRPTRGKEISFLECSPELIAEHITWIFMTYYNNIKGHDFLDKIWMSPKARSNHFLKILKIIDKLTSWTQEVILSFEAPEDRAEALAKFIRICKELDRERNYAGLVAIMVGLGETSVCRLARTKSYFADVYLNDKEDYLDLMEKITNYTAHLHISPSQSGVPWFDPIVSELLRIEDDIPERDTTGKRINWEQKEMLYNLITNTLQHQENNQEFLKNFKPDEVILSTINNFAHRSEDNLLTLSRTLEI